MGWFSKKPSDSKARIEELKKKIQAEQAAFNAAPEQAAAAPLPPPVPPAPAPMPVAPAAPVAAPVGPPAPIPQVVAPPTPPQYVQQPWPTPVQPEPQPVVQRALPQRPYVEDTFDQQPAPRRPQQLERAEEDLYMEEIKTGIVLDLGDGMSLNLPIRSRMRLDEFLHIADRVRELQRVQQPGHY